MFQLVSGLVVVTGLLAAAVLLARRQGWRPGDRRPDGGYALPIGLNERLRKPPGVLRWLTTVDHKDIGALYVVFGFAAGLWGGTDAMMIRTELLTPESTIWSATTYDALFTTHGLTMLIFFVTPVFTGLANYFVPLLIGADDMAFPRINAIAFWLLPPGALLIWGGFLLAPLGAYVLALGQLVFVWNVVTSWLEGPAVADGDPWDLAEHGAMTNEWRWFERQRQATVADGGGEEAAD